MTILIFIKLFDFCRVLFWGGVGVLLLVRFTVKATNMAADLDNQGHPPLQYRVAEKKGGGGGAQEVEAWVSLKIHKWSFLPIKFKLDAVEINFKFQL